MQYGVGCSDCSARTLLPSQFETGSRPSDCRFGLPKSRIGQTRLLPFHAMASGATELQAWPGLTPHMLLEDINPPSNMEAERKQFNDEPQPHPLASLLPASEDQRLGTSDSSSTAGLNLHTLFEDIDPPFVIEAEKREFNHEPQPHPLASLLPASEDQLLGTSDSSSTVTLARPRTPGRINIDRFALDVENILTAQEKVERPSTPVGVDLNECALDVEMTAAAEQKSGSCKRSGSLTITTSSDQRDSCWKDRILQQQTRNISHKIAVHLKIAMVNEIEKRSRLLDAGKPLSEDSVDGLEDAADEQQVYEDHSGITETEMCLLQSRRCPASAYITCLIVCQKVHASASSIRMLEHTTLAMYSGSKLYVRDLQVDGIRVWCCKESIQSD